MWKSEELEKAVEALEARREFRLYRVVNRSSITKAANPYWAARNEHGTANARYDQPFESKSKWLVVDKKSKRAVSPSF